MTRVNRNIYLAAGLAAAVAAAGLSLHAVTTPSAVVRNASTGLLPPDAPTSVAGGGGDGQTGGYAGMDTSPTTGSSTGAHPGAGTVAEPPAGVGDLATSLVARIMPKMGTVVTDGAGFVLYRFDKDRSNPPTSNCVASCAKTWPPVLTAAGVPALRGIDRSLVGTVRRADGSVQLTIAGWPVYHYSGDTRAGAWKGQGSAGVWWVIAPNGHRDLVGVPTATPTAPPPSGSGYGGGGDNGAAGYGGDPQHW